MRQLQHTAEDIGSNMTKGGSSTLKRLWLPHRKQKGGESDPLPAQGDGMTQTLYHKETTEDKEIWSTRYDLTESILTPSHRGAGLYLT